MAEEKMGLCLFMCCCRERMSPGMVGCGDAGAALACHPLPCGSDGALAFHHAGMMGND